MSTAALHVNSDTAGKRTSTGKGLHSLFLPTGTLDRENEEAITAVSANKYTVKIARCLNNSVNK